MSKFNIKKIADIYDKIKVILPSTYKKPKLAFFEDEESMLENTNIKKAADEANIYAVVDPNTSTINLPLKMTFEYEKDNGENYTKVVHLNKLDAKEIAHTLLHECAHIYFGERYGYDSKEYADESACNAFAKRWVDKMKKQKLI